MNQLEQKLEQDFGIVFSQKEPLRNSIYPYLICQ